MDVLLTSLFLYAICLLLCVLLLLVPFRPFSLNIAMQLSLPTFCCFAVGISPFHRRRRCYSPYISLKPT
ncbi:hypothetical protein F4819DRAFT_256346 [Hypoxylon fuscum]|nr:hypothetical protein F4819DRAFT_256346 [Hypoxylon fuscum]